MRIYVPVIAVAIATAFRDNAAIGIRDRSRIVAIACAGARLHCVGVWSGGGRQ